MNAMKKFLIATLLLLVMSGATLAADKPKVIVIVPDISQDIYEHTDFRMNLFAADLLMYEQHLIVSDLVDSKKIVVYDFESAFDQKLNVEDFIKKYGIQYIVKADIKFVNTNILPDQNLGFYLSEASVSLSLIDAKTQEILFATNTRGKAECKEPTERQGTIEFDAVSSATKKATDELLKYFYTPVR